MNIYQALEGENTRIRQAFIRLLDTTAAQGSERSDLVDEIRARLLAQKEVEESFIYPVILNLESTRAEAQKLMEEQRTVLEMVEEMAAARKEETEFQYRIENLYSEIFAHLEHQEQKLFELARKAIPEEQAEDLGIRVKEGLGRVRSKYLH